MKIKWKPFLISLAIPLAVGALSGFLTSNSMEVYERVAKPALAPPPWLFPIVWTVLFVLMGISAYLVYESDARNRQEALLIYAIQLLINFLWPIFFFIMQAYLFSFFWLLLLLVAILLMIWQFYQARPIAGILQIPYLLWILFAGYLNLSIFFLSR